MPKSKKILIGKIACILSVIPALILAHEYGPDAGYTGAPGDNPTACIASGCHAGTVNAFSGNVKILLPSSTYTPGGSAIQVQVQITDSAMKVFGFELTARSGSANKTQAGDFSTTDALTQVICEDDSVKANGKSCASQFPIQDIEHTLAGYNASFSGGATGTYTYSFNWTPPATNVGNVTMYVAANASKGDLQQNSGHIYTSNIVLTPGAGGGATPNITSVTNGASFSSTMAAGTYITISGTNLAPAGDSRLWAGTDFGKSGSNTTLPTALDNVSVSVNGKAAYVEYISPTQINAILPSTVGTGSGIAVQVSNAGQNSNTMTVTLQPRAPAFFAFAPGTSDDGKYPAAAHANDSTCVPPACYLGKVGLYPSAPNLTKPAAPGEIITLYGTGFGATTPGIADGIVTDKVYNVAPAPTVTIGGATATVTFAGLVPPFAAVYQLNVTVPATLANGDQAIVATIAGQQSQSGLFITVQK